MGILLHGRVLLVSEIVSIKRGAISEIAGADNRHIILSGTVAKSYGSTFGINEHVFTYPDNLQKSCRLWSGWLWGGQLWQPIRRTVGPLAEFPDAPALFHQMNVLF